MLVAINPTAELHELEHSGFAETSVQVMPDIEDTSSAFAPGTHLNRLTGEIRNTHVYKLRTAGEILEIEKTATEPFDRTSEAIYDPMNWREAPSVATRGEVSEFSDKSRRRLAKNCAAIPWGTARFYFVTLTYPGEYSSNGRRVKADLQNLRRAWTRHYGLPLAVWKMEFQWRGAPHFHLAIAAPHGVPMEVVRRWLAGAWFRIVGSGDERHLRAGTQLDVMQKPPTAYFSSHGQHGRDSKGYQNEIPEGYESAGRFWGFWNLAPDWVEHELDRDEFVQARRMMRAWARANGYKTRRNGGRIQGMWLRTRRKPALNFASQLLRALEVAT